MIDRKNFSAGRDYEQYLHDLEEVYGVDIHFRFDPKASSVPGVQKMIIAGCWKTNEPWDDSPDMYGEYEVAMWPKERLNSTMMRALVEFTYEVMEAYCQAIPDPTLRRN